MTFYFPTNWDRAKVEAWCLERWGRVPVNGLYRTTKGNQFWFGLCVDIDIDHKPRVACDTCGHVASPLANVGDRADFPCSAPNCTGFYVKW